MKRLIPIILICFLLAACNPKVAEMTNEKPSEEHSGLYEDVKSDVIRDVDENNNSYELFNEQFNKFSGRVDDKLAIGMLLWVDEYNDITGNFFYKDQQIKIPLIGSFHNNRLELYELDQQGNKVGKFEGEVVSEHLEVKGVKTDLKSNKSVSLSLRLESAFPRHLDNLYVDAGAPSTEEVENFAKALKKEILSGAKFNVARKISYPISVEVKDEEVSIENEKQFMDKFDDIFYHDYLTSIKAGDPINMDSSYRGIMFGDRGEIWLNYVFSEDPSEATLKVTSINNSRDAVNFYLEEINGSE
ncbi:hypothetical protein CDO73_01475 [Saccharibacillus sp. O23]|uniref:hypothetical protein n=1 Tax=Saccharibacillus sp. O23 TaxID=2009338 RepID=UPI000B4E6EF9|nr:hypothetical protein [Saccharibacillus sp. O23]OWR32307.1 hypothetical protein CDO73_01475 [Saccharibacillus sp. O23]